MRVDDVVVAGLVLGLLAQHRRGEGAQLGGQLLLAQPLERAGADVPHGDAGAHLDDRRQVAGGRAGEDVDGDAAGGQPAGDLDDVDVHAAGVAGAGLVERAGVHREGRHPPGRAGAGETASGHVQPPARLVRWSGAGPAPCRLSILQQRQDVVHARYRSVPLPRSARRCPAPGRTAVVTGASSGIGAATAHAPGRRGFRRRPRRPAARPADVAGGVDRRAARCRWTSPTPARWRRSPPRWTGSTCWSTTPAASFDAAPVADADLDSWARTYDVNVLGTVRRDQGAAAGAAGLRRRRRRVRRLDRGAGLLRGRRVVHRGQARGAHAGRDAAAGAERRAGPGDRDRAGDGAHRGVLAEPARVARRPGRRRLPRGARAAGRRGHRRLHRLDGHPPAPREHRPDGGPPARPGRPAQGRRATSWTVPRESGRTRARPRSARGRG